MIEALLGAILMVGLANLALIWVLFNNAMDQLAYTEERISDKIETFKGYLGGLEDEINQIRAYYSEEQDATQE